MKDAELVYGEKYGYHTHYLPLQAAVDFLAEQFEMMQTASLTVDRDMTVCQCEYRKEGGVNIPGSVTPVSGVLETAILEVRKP